MLPNSVLIHCDPSLLDFAKENNMSYDIDDTKDYTELNIVVDDIPYEILRGDYQDPDEQLCEHYGIDYDQVYCIEAMY